MDLTGRLADLVLRRPFLESGTSHSGGANSFSPSEPLLWPSSGTELLDNSLTKSEGRESSSFPSPVGDQTCQRPVWRRGEEPEWRLGGCGTLTSLFLHGPRLWDAGERVESFGCKALTLFVFQGGNIGQLQGTEGNKINAIKQENEARLAVMSHGHTPGLVRLVVLFCGGLFLGFGLNGETWRLLFHFFRGDGPSFLFRRFLERRHVAVRHCI